MHVFRRAKHNAYDTSIHAQAAADGADDPINRDLSWLYRPARGPEMPLVKPIRFCAAVGVNGLISH
jgi:hypothetical protein